MSENTLLQKHFAHRQKEEEMLERHRLKVKTENFHLAFNFLKNEKNIERIEKLLITEGKVIIIFESMNIPFEILENEKLVSTKEKIDKYTYEWNQKGVRVENSENQFVFTLEGSSDIRITRISKTKADLTLTNKKS